MIARILKKLSLWLIATSVAMSTPLLYAHGGGLDRYGCHYNRKVGNYHCHRGQFAGRTFSSQAEMLKLLNER